MNIKKAVVKVGTSTLTHDSGLMNFRRIERLARTLSDIKNSGTEVIFVSSGAISVGMGKLGLTRRPEKTREKQAVAAVGQVELMDYTATCSANTALPLPSFCLPGTFWTAASVKKTRLQR